MKESLENNMKNEREKLEDEIRNRAFYFLNRDGGAIRNSIIYVAVDPVLKDLYRILCKHYNVSMSQIMANMVASVLLDNKELLCKLISHSKFEQTYKTYLEYLSLLFNESNDLDEDKPEEDDDELNVTHNNVFGSNIYSIKVLSQINS